MEKGNEHGADNFLPVTYQLACANFWIRSVTRAADESEVNAYIESSKAEIEAKAEMNAYIESRKVEIEAKAAENKAKLVLRGEAELY